jgi:glycosyltransferase involved in cell wall biosynthesis
MKIAVVILTRGDMSGGARKYLRRLVPLLCEQSGVECVDVFVPPQAAGNGERTWPENDELRGYPVLRKTIGSLRPDVLFIPTARMLRVPGVPVVTMVRNMEPLEVPFGGNTWMEGMRNVARAAAARSACRRSDRVIAVSRHVRDFLLNRWRIPEARIGIVYHGIDDPSDEVVKAPVALRTMEGKRFLFAAGSIRPARGLEDVISALAGTPSDVMLVIAGAVDRGAESYVRRIRALAENTGLESRIVWAGQLDASGMAWCFRRATLFVMTSRAEACPNTVLEAMAHGVVSVSTDHAPMPEFFGDGALYYRERDAADLGRRIRQALDAPDQEQKRIRDQARARARLFTWESTARDTIAVLRRAIEHR